MERILFCCYCCCYRCCSVLWGLGKYEVLSIMIQVIILLMCVRSRPGLAIHFFVRTFIYNVTLYVKCRYVVYEQFKSSSLNKSMSRVDE